MSSLRFLLTAAGLSALTAAAAPAPATTPAAATMLFNGTDLTGLTYLSPSGRPIESVCAVKPDGVLAVNGKPIGYLVAAGIYANYRLHVEWRWTTHNPKSNGGVLVHITTGPIDRKTWPRCLQIQTKTTRAGDLLPMAGFTFAELPPGATQTDRQNPSSENPMGDWNTCDITCRGETVACWINGTFQNRATHASAASGHIGLQLEGYPYEMRNFRLEPLPAAQP